MPHMYVTSASTDAWFDDTHTHTYIYIIIISASCLRMCASRSASLGSELVMRLSRLVFSVHRPTVAALMSLGQDMGAAAAAGQVRACFCPRCFVHAFLIID